MKRIIISIFSLFIVVGTFCKNNLNRTNISVIEVNITHKLDNGSIKNFVLLFINENDTIVWQNKGIKNLQIGMDAKLFVETDSVEFVIENISKYMNYSGASYKISIAIGEFETDLNEIEYVNENGERNYDIYGPEHDAKMMNTVKFEIMP